MRTTDMHQCVITNLSFSCEYQASTVKRQAARVHPLQDWWCSIFVGSHHTCASGVPISSLRCATFVELAFNDQTKEACGDSIVYSQSIHHHI